MERLWHPGTTAHDVERPIYHAGGGTRLCQTGTQLSGDVAAAVGHTVGFTQRRGWLEGVGRTPGPCVLRGHSWSGFCRGCGPSRASGCLHTAATGNGAPQADLEAPAFPERRELPQCPGTLRGCAHLQVIPWDRQPVLSNTSWETAPGDTSKNTPQVIKA